MMAGDSQYILPFDAARNELLALIGMLRDRPLEIDGRPLSSGRSEGVVQLLERLALLGNDLTERAGKVYIRAQVVAIAARAARRKSTSERTVRNWRRDAERLGLLRTELRSQQVGGTSWNRYTIDVDCLRSWVAGNGRKRAETVAAPRAEAVSALGAEIISAPTHCLIQGHSSTTTAEPQTAPASLEAADSDGWPVVVSDLMKLGMSRTGASQAAMQARARGLDVPEARELIELYRERAQQQSATGGRRITPGWLHRWLTGESTPETPEPASVQSEQRGDAMSADEVRRERLRVQIVRGGRAAGKSEEEILSRLVAAGLEE